MSEGIAGKFSGLAVPVDEPARMPIAHPITGARLRDADGGEAYIEILGPDSAAAQKAARLRVNDMLRRRNPNARRTAEEIEDEVVGELASLTVGWRLVSLDGEPIDVPFSAAAARELYAAPSMLWLREQVLAFQGDRANFCMASSKN